MPNPVRTCIGCTLTDDQPRHVIDMGGIDVNWHFQCHSIATGCDICAAELAKQSD
jgi:hypothetical protein